MFDDIVQFNNDFNSIHHTLSQYIMPITLIIKTRINNNSNKCTDADICHFSFGLGQQ